MSVTDDPNIILVFVDNTDSVDESVGAISGDDLTSWLSIVGEVEYIKMQFDVTSGRPCFSVRFQRSDAARLTVQHLSGVKLKNCTMTIRSRAFAKVSASHPAAVVSASDEADSASETAAPVKQSRTLPDNHRMPEDIRVDPELADFLDRCYAGKVAVPSEAWVDLPALRDALASRQREVAETLDAVREAEQLMARADAAILAVRSEISDTGSRSGGGNRELPGACPASAPARAGASSLAVAGALAVRNRDAIRTSQCSPSRLVSHITEHFGPITRCHCQLDASGGQNRYFLTVTFMMPGDGESFLADVSAGRAVYGKLKRPRMDGDLLSGAGSSGDAEMALYGADWEA